MRAIRTQLVILLSSFLLIACSTPSIHLPVSNAARGALTSTDVVVPIRQSEIYIFVPMATGGAGFGLIGALVDTAVDSERTSKAEGAVTPLRNAMVDYSFDSALQDELKTSLSQVAWLHAGNYGVTHDISNDGLGKALAASKASTVLFLVADYRLSNDGDVLFVTFQAALMPNTDQTRALIPGKRDEKTAVALTNALYRNRFVFEAHVNGTGDRPRNVAEWSANNGAAARAALTMAVKKLVPLLVDDIQRAEGDIAPPANAPLVANSTPSEVTECNIAPSEAQCGKNAVLLGQDQDGQILRFKDGSLKYFKTGNFGS
jgi:hypothetical protein